MRERAPRGGEARQEPFTTSDPGQGEHHEPELLASLTSQRQEGHQGPELWIRFQETETWREG